MIHQQDLPQAGEALWLAGDIGGKAFFPVKAAARREDDLPFRVAVERAP